ncbi:hypothetical protein DFH09DRAFT_1088593 [Mycena vulgaris]|nr:hypothetical protein DFH09DRAFT_1088593 [Mycena vulgaris]
MHSAPTISSTDESTKPSITITIVAVEEGIRVTVDNVATFIFTTVAQDLTSSETYLVPHQQRWDVLMSSSAGALSIYAGSSKPLADGKLGSAYLSIQDVWYALEVESEDVARVSGIRFQMLHV